jgi:predicted membrane channel-forming protein YqfA (hemolysin III family)
MKIQYCVLTVLLLGSAPSAFSYLDPGTGSMLLQVILGGVAAVGVALKLFWHKIRAALGMSKKPVSGDETG